MVMLRILLPLLLTFAVGSLGKETEIKCIRRLRNLDVKDTTVCVAVDDATATRLKPEDPGLNMTLLRIERENACKPLPHSPALRGRTLVVLSNICTLATMMRNARDAGATGLVIVANLTYYPMRLNIGDDPDKIPVVVIAANLYNRLVHNSSQSLIKVLLLPSLDTGRGAAPIIAFFFLTLVCLATGMWFSVHGQVDVSPNMMMGAPRQRSSSEEPLTGTTVRRQESRSAAEKDCGACSSTCPIIILVIFSAGSLLLLYFFYDIFVWVVMFMICILFTCAFKSMALEGIVRVNHAWNERCTVHIRRQWLRCLIGESFDTRGLLILPLCAIPAILWVVYRKDTFTVWIIQDICGVAGCIFIIKTVRFGSLKLIAFLVSLFFIYDIFMVYITPFLMQKRKPVQPTSGFTWPIYQNSSVSRVRRSTDEGMSVMESVATGAAGKSGEKLPILFTIPSVNFDGSYSLEVSYSPFEPCYYPKMALLGFGDIIVPGILLAYAFWCDSRLRTPQRRLPWLYSAAGLVGYQVGLGLVYVLLYVMRSGQPALLMLIPCTLLPFVVIAAVRRELAKVWHGMAPPTPPPTPHAAEPFDESGENVGQGLVSESAEQLETDKGDAAQQP